MSADAVEHAECAAGRPRTSWAGCTRARMSDPSREAGETALAADRIHGGRQITDLYLLALAVRHRGRLATFDTAIPLSTVPAATPANMVIV